jgi:hypothetical protein
MMSTGFETLPARYDAPPSLLRARRAILIVNGIFLVLVGAVQMTLELLGHHLGVGPLGQAFAGSPYTIGFVEAHGLALIFGVLFLRAAAGSDIEAFWHGTGAIVHLLLGGANLLFWQSFVTFDLVPMGIVATAFHAVFALAQSWAAMVASVSRA